MSRDRLYIDSCYFIDAIKYRSGFPIDPSRSRDITYVQECLKAARSGEIEVVTSMLTIAEVRRAGDPNSLPDANVKRLIRSVLASGKIVKLSEVTQGVAEKARDLHWDYGINLSGADAIHVATAIMTECKEFLTVDERRKSPHTYSAEIAALGVRVIRAADTRLLPLKSIQGDLLSAATEPTTE
jgi:predicted nucleic acid-binding protein